MSREHEAGSDGRLERPSLSGEADRSGVQIVAHDVWKAYGDVQALAGASLTVHEGQIVALVGRNGAGKTTLISCLLGLDACDRGHVSLRGMSVDELRHRRHEAIGTASQNTAVIGYLTVRQNLVHFARLRDIWGAANRAEVASLTQEFLLGSLLERRADRLSNGERRRLHIALAMIGEPEVLLLDEPTVGADLETRDALLTAVRRRAEGGVAVLLSTHYIGEVESLGADVAVIEAGVIVDRRHWDDLMRLGGSAEDYVRRQMGLAAASSTSSQPVLTGLDGSDGRR